MSNNDFIKVVDNFLSGEECDRFIRIYNEFIIFIKIGKVN